MNSTGLAISRRRRAVTLRTHTIPLPLEKLPWKKNDCSHKTVIFRYSNELKSSYMSATEMRSELHQLIDQIDERFLKAVYLTIRAYQEKDPIVSYDIDGTPRTASELTAILDEEVEAARRGDFMTIEEFRKQSAQWGQSTR